MEKDKNMLLGELYGLRAGLSVISQNNDSINDYKKSIQQSHFNIQEKQTSRFYSNAPIIFKKR